MKNLTVAELEAKRDSLYEAYDEHTKNARITSSIRNMNLYMGLAKKAADEAFEISNYLISLI